MEEIPAKYEETPKPAKKSRSKPAPKSVAPKPEAPKVVHTPRVRRNKPLGGQGRTGVGSRTHG